MSIKLIEHGVINEELESKIQLLKERKIHLSASKLKSMTSPINFCLGLVEKKIGKGMSFGSIVDAMLTDSENVDNRFIISDETPSQGNQMEVVKKVMNSSKEYKKLKSIEERVLEAYNLVYKRANESTLKFITEYCRNLESGREYVTKEVYDKAEFVANNLKTQPELSVLFDNAKGLQMKLEANYRGWDFVGFLDMFKQPNYYDLKFSSKLKEDKLDRTVVDFGYDLQFGVYSILLKCLGYEQPTGHFIFFDDKGNYAFRKFGQDFQIYAEKKVDLYINRLEQMIKDDAWFRSYDYFYPSKEINKPKWLKLDYGSRKFL